jgi:acyl-ACP thioesterase
MVTAPFTELVDHPGAGRAYTETRRSGIDTAAPTGRVRLDAIARWLQDLAYRDLVDAGWARPVPWFVRRLRIRAERFPVFTERVELTTWCSALGPSVAERRTSLRGAEGADVEAVAQWISVDPETARPAPLDEAFRATFAPSAAGRRSRTRLRHPSAPPAGATARPFVFRASDLDAARHVNNAAYWAVLEEELVAHPPDARLDAEVEHRSAASPGPVEVHADGAARWVVARDEVVATAVLG